MAKKQTTEPVTMVTIGEAARILRVHPDTLRRWEKRGAVQPKRHPVNGYRLFRKDWVHDLKEQLE